MAENINGSDLLGSGGHVWRWGPKNITAKGINPAGIAGEFSMVTALGARSCTVTGKRGEALLTAAGASKAAVDAALNALENAIIALETTGEECTWEDDQGRTGTALVITGYVKGAREYQQGATWAAWQHYTLGMKENDGAF